MNQDGNTAFTCAGGYATVDVAPMSRRISNCSLGVGEL